MNIEDIKATMENLETGVFDRTTGTKELFLPMFEYLLSVIEQAEKALTYYAEEPYLTSIGYATQAVEALQAIRKGD